VQQQYTTQEFGYMLVAVGTILLVLAGILWVAYGIFLAVPEKARPTPPDLAEQPNSPPPVFLQGRMAPQRTHYTPRHERPLSVPQDPWMGTAYTEVR
jgi:hypothetical protein